MGFDKLSNTQIKFLQYLVFILLTVLTVTTAWTMQEMYRLKCDLPKDYVMSERYKADSIHLNRAVERIDSKLDRLIERTVK